MACFLGIGGRRQSVVATDEARRWYPRRVESRWSIIIADAAAATRRRLARARGRL